MSIMKRTTALCLCLSALVVGAWCGEGLAATSTNDSILNDTIPSVVVGGGEGCYDMAMHKCDCDAGITKESCEEKGSIYTDQCACAATPADASEGKNKTENRRTLLDDDASGGGTLKDVTKTATKTATTATKVVTGGGSSSTDDSPPTPPPVNGTVIPSGQGAISQPLPSGFGCFNETNLVCSCEANVTQTSCESKGLQWSSQCACTEGGVTQREIYTNFTSAGDEIPQTEGRRQLMLEDLYF